MPENLHDFRGTLILDTYPLLILLKLAQRTGLAIYDKSSETAKRQSIVFNHYRITTSR